MEKPLTGRKVLMITLAFFGVIILVNLFMAYSAISTFPGLEVENSYVASQTFDKDRAAQVGLGWRVTVAVENNELILSFTDDEGQPVQVASLEAILGRPTERKDDLVPAFAFQNGAYHAPVNLDFGNWELRFKAQDENGTLFRQTRELYVRK